MGPIARGQITLVDLSDIISQSTAPANPTEGMLWMNTGVTPPVLMVYREGKWVQQNDFKQDPEYNVIKETLTTNTSGIDVLKDEIKLKVSQTEVANTVKTEIDKVQVGGTNLLLNSAFLSGANWTGSVSIDTNKKYLNYNSVKFTSTTSAYANFINASPGEVYSISAKSFTTADVTSKLLIIFEEFDATSTTRISYQETEVSNVRDSWQNYAKTWTVTNSLTKRIRLRLYSRSSVGTTWISLPKLEKGNKTTDWAPAPEDTQTQITEINDKTSEITQNLEGITSRVSSVESNQTTIGGNVTNLQARVAEAESKITPDAIVNTVKNSQTNGKDTFVQTSTLEQTTESITASFKSSGGDNLLLNSNAKNSTNYWSIRTYNVVPTTGITHRFGIRNDTHSGNEDAFEFYVNGAMTSGELGFYQDIKTVIGKQYVLTGYLAGHRSNKNIVVRGTTSSESGWLASKSYGDITGGTTLTNWTKIEIPFIAQRTTTRIELDINKTNPTTLVDGYIWAKQLMVIEGKEWRPWQPNASEIYDGITTINKDGIKVNSSNANTYTQMSSTGFYLKKNDGTSLLTADANGLALTGKITVTSGSNVDAGLSQGIKDQINQSAKEIYDGTFNFGKSYWSNTYEGEDLNATTKGTVVKDGFDGGNVLEFTSQTWLYSKNPIAIDVNRKYRVRFRVRKTVAGTGTMRVYAGVVTLDKNLNNLTGGTGTHRYCAASGKDIPTSNDWTVFEGIITGVGDTANNFRDGTCYVRPMFLVNYDTGTGTTQVDMISFEDITDSKNAQDTANSAQSTANSVTSTVNAGKDKWGQAYDRVAQWAYGAVSGSTTINGGLIQTNTILADKIAVGDFTNLCKVNEISSPGGYTVITHTDNYKYFKIGPSQYTKIDFSNTKDHRFALNDTYKLRFTGWKDSAVTTPVFIFRMHYSDGGSPSYSNLGTASITTLTSSPTTQSIELKITSLGQPNRPISSITMFIESGASSNGYYYLRNITLNKMASGELIVDGSITTNKITASGISADKIKAGSLVSTNNKTQINLDNGSMNIGTTSDASYLKYDTTNGLELKGKMTFTSGTTFPDSVLNDKIKLGGTNIVKNTKAPKDKSYWTYRPDNLNIARSILLDEDVFCITQTGTGEKYAGTERYRLEPNTQYTFSAKVYLDENVKGLTAYWLSRSSGNTSEYQYIINLFSGWNATKKAWVKVSKTFTTNSSEYEGYLRMDHAGSSVSTGANTLWFTEVQIEKGNTVSDWSPAASEVISNIEGAQGSADNANKVAEEANSTANQAAGIVKDLTTIDELNGNATVIDGGKILTGSITAEKIKTYDFAVYNKVTKDRTFYINDIGDVEITGELKSNNFDSSNGSLGYKVTPDGLAHFNQAIINGEIKLPNSGMTNYGSRNQSNPNLLLNSNLRRGRESWAGINQIQIDVDYSMGMDGSASVVIESYDRTTDGWLGPTQRFGTNNFNGKTLTASLWYYVRNIETFDSDFTLEVKSTRTGQAYDVGIASLNVTKDTMVQGKWTKISVTFVVPSDVTVIYIYPWVRRNGMIWITNMKVEEGSEATPWCLSESEMGEQIRIWSGASYEQRHDAPFRVLQNGNVNIKGGYFDGVFSGTINLANNRLTLSSTEGYVHNNSQGNPINVISPSTTYFTTNFAVKALNGSTYFGVSQDGAGSVEVNTDTFKIGSNLTFSSQKANLLKIGSIGHTLSLNDLNLLTMTSKNSGVGKDFRFERSSGNVSIEVAGSLEVTNSVNVGKVQMIKREADATNPGIDFIIL